MVQPESQDDDLSDLGAVPVEQAAAPTTPEAQGGDDDLSDLGATPVEQPQEGPGLASQAIDTAEAAFPNATGIVKEGAKKLFSTVSEIANDPYAQSVDPATKAGLTLQKTIQSTFDEGGELLATRLATSGLNPYVAAAAGTAVQEIPDIMFSTEGIAAIKAAGNARAESALLDRIANATKVFPKKPLEIGYELGVPIDAPTTVLPAGKPLQLENEAMKVERGATSLLKGEKQLALPEPNVVRSPDEPGTLYRGHQGEDLNDYGPGKFVAETENQAKAYGNTVDRYKYTGDKNKILDSDSREFTVLSKRYLREHPEEIEYGGSNPDFSIYPTKGWIEYLSQHGYEGTANGNELFILDQEKLKQAEGFTMRDKPDLAKLQPPVDPVQRDAQPTYPKDMKGPKAGSKSVSKSLNTLHATHDPEMYTETYGQLEGLTSESALQQAESAINPGETSGIPKAGKPGFQILGPNMSQEADGEGSSIAHFSPAGKLDMYAEYMHDGGKLDYINVDLESHDKSHLTHDLLDFLKKSGLDTSNFKKTQLSMAEEKAVVKPGESMRQYAARKKLSADVPEFPQVQDNVAPADLYNPAISELVDESRRQYVGVDPRIQIVKNTETGRTSFRLKKDPDFGKYVVSEAEHAANQATKGSAAVAEMDLDPRIVNSSPNLPGTETVPSLKDGVVAGSQSWLQSQWNRIGVSAEDAISRMGQSGKQLANGIRILRDVPQVRYGEFSAGFDTFLSGLSKKQAKEVSISLTNALEGRKVTTTLPQGLVEYVQQKFKVIADEAEAVGLQVRNSSGELMPFAPRDNYFPRVLRQEIFDGLISGDNKVMAEVAQKMVNNKQQPNFQMAFERVKYMRNKMMSNKYGHLERAREVDLPPELYDRNSLRVIPEYINSALHRIEEVRQFGLEGEKALSMLSMIQEEGGDAQLARAIFERFTRIEPRDTVTLKGMQGLRNITAGMLIQAQSTALQLGQSMMPAYEAGFVNAVKGFSKAWTDMGELEAKRAGQVFSIAAQDYLKESYGGGSYGFGSNFVEGVMKMTGFTRMDHFLRKYSALTAKEYIPQLVNKLVNNPGNKAAAIELEHLGYDVSKILRNKGLSAEELNVGAKRFADVTQGAPDTTTLPYYWTSPGGKLFAQFKNFSYLIGKQNASLLKRALKTGNVARLGEMAVGIPITGYVIGELRKAMVGESNSEITGNEGMDKVINVVANATAFGPSIDLFLQALQGPNKLKQFFLPISISNAAEVGGAAGKSLKEMDASYLVKTLLKKTPVAGRMLYNKAYGDE